jgi:hypothetical protein
MFQTRAVLTLTAVIIAIAVYYSTQTKSTYFYYDKEGRKVEVRQGK